MKFQARSNFCRLLECITIEPTVFLIFLSAISSNLIYMNLFLQKACRKNVTLEPDLSTPCDDEKAGQLFLTSINSWRFSLSMILMIIFTVLGTSWSEKAGKKRLPLIFIPLIGQAVINVIGWLYSYFWHWSAMPAVILEALIHGVTGGRFSIVYTAQLYVVDITEESNRTMRLGVLTFLHTIAIPLSNGITGFMLRRLGLSISFAICTAITILGIVCGYIFIKDISVPTTKEISFWRALNPTMIYESFKIIFKKRNFNRRKIIGLLLCADAMCLFPIIGESVVLYLYLRYRFSWNEEDYSIYIASKLLIQSIGIMFSSLVFSKYLKIHDAIIGVIACVTSMLASGWYIFSDQNWELYLGSVIEFIRPSTLIVISSFLTKCLDSDETGHLMSIRCILSVITPVCFPVYSFVYRETLDAFPAAFFLITLAICLSITFLLGFAYYLFRQIRVAEITSTFADTKEKTHHM